MILSTIRIERVYDFIKRSKGADEYAVLVDRLWPRGVTKAKLRHDAWMKDVAPSTALRQWWLADPDRWHGFGERYRNELLAQADALASLRATAAKQKLTLLYASKNKIRNHAAILRDVLEA